MMANTSGDPLGNSSLSTVNAAPLKSEKMVERFYTDMETMVEEMENMLRESTLLAAVKVNSHLERIEVKFLKMKEFVTETGKFLPLYDVKKSQMTISSLTTQFQEKHEKMKPKKLGFKRSNQIKAPDISSLSVVDAGPGYSISGSLSNMTDQVVILTREQVESRDVSLDHLTNCRVEIQGSPLTITNPGTLGEDEEVEMIINEGVGSWEVRRRMCRLVSSTGGATQ